MSSSSSSNNNNNNSGRPQPKFKIGDRVNSPSLNPRVFHRIVKITWSPIRKLWRYTLDGGEILSESDLEPDSDDSDTDGDDNNNNNSSSSTTTTTTTTNNNNNNSGRPQPKFEIGDAVRVRYRRLAGGNGLSRPYTIINMYLDGNTWEYTLSGGETNPFGEEHLEGDLELWKRAYRNDNNNNNNAEYKIEVGYMVDYHNPLELEEWESLLVTTSLEVVKVDMSSYGSGKNVTITVNTNKTTANKKTYLARMVKELADTLAEEFTENKLHKDIDGIKQGLTEADLEYDLDDLEYYAYATVLFADEEGRGKIIVTDKLDTDGNARVSEAKEMPLGSSFRKWVVHSLLGNDNDNNNNMMKKPPPKELNEMEKEQLAIRKRLKFVKGENKLMKEKAKKARKKWEMAARREKRSTLELRAAKRWQKKIKNLSLDEYQKLIKDSFITQMNKCENKFDGLLYSKWDPEDFKNTIFLRFEMPNGSQETWCLVKKFYPKDPNDPQDKDVTITQDKYIDDMLYANWVEKSDGSPYKKDSREGKGGEPGNERYVRINAIFNGMDRYVLLDDALRQVIQIKRGDGRNRNTSTIGFDANIPFPMAIYLKCYKNVAIGNIRGSMGISETKGNIERDIYVVTNIQWFGYYEDLDDIDKYHNKHNENNYYEYNIKVKKDSSSSSGAKRKKPGLKF